MPDTYLLPGDHTQLRHLCGLHRVLARQWEPHILVALARQDRPMRHAELLHAIHRMTLTNNTAQRPISDKVLRETLDAMHRIGLIARQHHPSEYELTPAASRLLAALRPAVEWAANHPGIIQAAGSDH